MAMLGSNEHRVLNELTMTPLVAHAVGVRTWLCDMIVTGRKVALAERGCSVSSCGYNSFINAWRLMKTRNCIITGENDCCTILYVMFKKHGNLQKFENLRIEVRTKQDQATHEFGIPTRDKTTKQLQAKLKGQLSFSLPVIVWEAHQLLDVLTLVDSKIKPVSQNDHTKKRLSSASLSDTWITVWKIYSFSVFQLVEILPAIRLHSTTPIYFKGLTKDLQQSRYALIVVSSLKATIVLSGVSKLPDGREWPLTLPYWEHNSYLSLKEQNFPHVIYTPVVHPSEVPLMLRAEICPNETPNINKGNWASSP
ncbi:hypothetical protein B0H34DRAFT_679213 [Crassisporium funariophilum]|nr:hypothetical protein B0H34DRAFT_679213 [Crassisporium funariophilum]